MTTSDEFQPLDYPHQIVHIQVTEGHTDQDTGEWAPGPITETEIDGHISDISARELRHLPAGTYELGDRRLYTGDPIEPGDLVRVTEPGETATEWRVESEEARHHLFAAYGIVRRVYHLKRHRTI